MHREDVGGTHGTPRGRVECRVLDWPDAPRRCRTDGKANDLERGRTAVTVSPRVPSGRPTQPRTICQRHADKLPSTNDPRIAAALIAIARPAGNLFASLASPIVPRISAAGRATIMRHPPRMPRGSPQPGFRKCWASNATTPMEEKITAVLPNRASMALCYSCMFPGRNPVLIILRPPSGNVCCSFAGSARSGRSSRAGEARTCGLCPAGT